MPNENTKYYECSFRKDEKVKCRARMTIKNNEYILSGRHVCEWHEKFELGELKKEIETSSPYDTTRIIKKGYLQSEYDHLLDLTTILKIEKSIERHRKKDIGQIGQDLNSLHCCLQKDNWRQLLKLDAADAFVVEFIVKQNNTKGIIFIDRTLTNKIMDINKEKVIIFVDGTFVTVPQLKNTNCQLWAILMRHNNRTFLIVYAIMEGRKTENYVDILRTVVNIVKIEPDIAICDFEKAEHNALKIVFPYVKVIGCFFHYSQALVHNAKKHGIVKGKEKELGWAATKLLISLAYLPEKLIVEGFHLIANVIFENCKMLQSFFIYYKETWINGFKPNSFSVFNETHGTNNISERHNRELKANIQKHSTIVKFLVYLTEHQKTIHSFEKHPKFWARVERKNIKEKKDALKNIWQKMKRNIENVDLLLILNKLSKLVGRKEINP